MADWGKILGTGIDAASYFVPAAGWGAQAISYNMTGQSLGANIAGDSYVPQIGTKSKADEMETEMNKTSIQQLQRAAELQKQLQEQGRPIKNEAYDTLKEANKLAKIYARQGMNETAYNRAVTNIERGASGALSAAASRGAGMQTLADIYGTTTGAFSDLASTDATIAQMNQAQYLQSFNPLAGAAGEAEAYNELLPYEQKVAEMQSYLASSQQNKWNSMYFDYQQAVNQQQMLADLTGSAVGAAGATI